MVTGEGRETPVMVAQGVVTVMVGPGHRHGHFKRCQHANFFLVKDSSPGFLIKHFSFHWLTSAPAPGLTLGIPFQDNLSINSPLTCEAA